MCTLLCGIVHLNMGLTLMLNFMYFNDDDDDDKSRILKTIIKLLLIVTVIIIITTTLKILLDFISWTGEKKSYTRGKGRCSTVQGHVRASTRKQRKVRSYCKIGRLLEENMWEDTLPAKEKSYVHIEI